MSFQNLKAPVAPQGEFKERVYIRGPIQKDNDKKNGIFFNYTIDGEDIKKESINAVITDGSYTRRRFASQRLVCMSFDSEEGRETSDRDTIIYCEDCRFRNHSDREQRCTQYYDIRWQTADHEFVASLTITGINALRDYVTLLSEQGKKIEEVTTHISRVLAEAQSGVEYRAYHFEETDEPSDFDQVFEEDGGDASDSSDTPEVKKEKKPRNAKKDKVTKSKKIDTDELTEKEESLVQGLIEAQASGKKLTMNIVVKKLKGMGHSPERSLLMYNKYEKRVAENNE